jgi:transcriptional regulator with XRE-family HTH domain
MRKQRATLTDEIRQAVDSSGLSRYRIAKELGIAESTMSRFMNGQGLSFEYLDALAGLLDLHIVTGTKPKMKSKGR